MLNENKIALALGKKRLKMVKLIEVGSECAEVVLKTGHKNEQTHETIHTFGLHHLADNGGDMTEKDYKDDLLFWFDYIV